MIPNCCQGELSAGPIAASDVCHHSLFVLKGMFYEHWLCLPGLVDCPWLGCALLDVCGKLQAVTGLGVVIGVIQPHSPHVQY